MIKLVMGTTLGTKANVSVNYPVLHPRPDLWARVEVATESV